MHLNKSQQMSKNKKKGQIIKTLTLKWKMKRHYMKRSDGISTASKEQNDSSFSFFANKFFSFFISNECRKKIC
jgi:hypothetical protein